MSGSFYLDWAISALSLFNTTLMLWLGLTVLLNAERRTWGIWLAGGGLVMGAGFFFSHSAILGHGLNYLGQGIDFWWRIGWTLVITLPFAWYVIMLWYAGFWSEENIAPTSLARTRRSWLGLTVLLVVALVALLVLAYSLPSFAEITQRKIAAVPIAGSLPLLGALFPLYIILCIALALDALIRPGPSERAMGDLARCRARPWLIGTSLVLLAVSMIVTWVMMWTLMSIGPRTLYGFYYAETLTLARFDLVSSAAIAVAVILLGQAIVSYEVFTGKTLPRRGFRLYWHRAILLATGFGILVGWNLTIQLRPIYGFLLTTALVVVFYALLSWRSFAERERTINRLRPFVASQQLYEHLITRPACAPLEIDVATPFRALCEDVLGARLAHLIALGTLAGLFGPALSHPDRNPPSLPNLEEVTAQLDSPQQMCLPLDPARYEGAGWVVPLWSERGLIGILLLGQKRDGGLYTQEEIEIARSIGERLIDTQASAEMAHRLMALQRTQLAENQVLDRQTRRALHDDILPQLHTAILTLSSVQTTPNEMLAETLTLLSQVHHQMSGLLRGVPATGPAEVNRLGLIGALRQAVHGELESDFDEVSWLSEPEAERRAEDIPLLTAEVIFYAAREAIRNAARHGRDRREESGSQPLNLRVETTWRSGLVLKIEDDGVGLSAEERTGSGGRGLALHSTMMGIVGGELEMESQSGACTRVLLTLPQSKAR